MNPEPPGGTRAAFRTSVCMQVYITALNPKPYRNPLFVLVPVRKKCRSVIQLILHWPQAAYLKPLGIDAGQGHARAPPLEAQTLKTPRTL